MRLIDIVNGPWAIRPQMLEEIQRIYSSHLHRSQKIDLRELEAAAGRKLDNQPGRVQLVDGVAVIPLHGVIGKRMNLFTQISGGVSTDLVASDFQAAIDDPAVRGIVLHVDSPGGTVDGTQQLADIISANKGKKPVVACADGMMCSAAYWIAAQADLITMADLTTDVGSIGVVASHMDISQWEEKQGIKTTEVTAGRYKRAISQYHQLSDEGRAMLQADVDQIYQIFVGAVAKGRGVDESEVLLRMADGRVFLGQKAIEAGLVDSVSTLADTIQLVREMTRGTAQPRRASVAASAPKGATTMNIEQLKAEHPELVQAIVAEATSDFEEAMAAAQVAGATAERERIVAVRATAVPGFEALIEQMAFDGKSTAADAALAIVATQKKQGAVAVANLDADANPPLPAADGGEGGTKTMKRVDFNALDQPARRAFLGAGGKISG